MAHIDEGVIARLRAMLGPAGLKQGEALSALDPGVHPENLAAGIAALPASPAEVARLLAFCNEVGLPVVPQGGRTGLAGAGVSRPGELVLATERLARIEDLDPESGVALAEAGVTLAALDAAAAPHGLMVGVDLSARGSCTLGGLIATNAGGMEAFRQGTMRHQVLGLEAALADGRLMSDLTRVLKANAGYDVKQLFIGSEGTLGVVTRAAIRLLPRRAPGASALVACPDAAAAVALFRRLLRLEGAALARAELMSANHVATTARALGLARLAAFAAAPLALVIELEAAADAAARLEAALAEAFEAGLVADAALAKSEQERAEIWRVREDWAVDRIFPGGLWFDLSLPLGALAGYLAALAERLRAHDPALALYVIGHLGDGNLHVTVNAARPIAGRYEEIAPLVYAGLKEVGGSFSAEHGIGLEKRAALAREADPVKLALMRSLKRSLDPKGILNPGKVLAD